MTVWLRRLLASISFPVVALAQAPAMPPGIDRTPLVDNPAVMIARLTMKPGARETVHTHPFSAVVIQLTPGDVEMAIASEKTTATRATGLSWFIARDTSHAAANVGKAPFEVVTVALKQAPGSPAPASATPVPAGISRTTVIDNDATRVVRVAFEPGAREVVHAHPYDLVVVQLTAGTVEAMIGSDRSTADRQAGYVWYMPKEVPHLVGNAGTTAFEVMSVAVK